ncbi:ArdC family protein [Phaeobacter gallaeciensis]|uniref:Zincin-like metallopeptidase domain-containing protein n=1 Tax=Phaeobacter gallaeciensis TaxID=60890 RepID=A0ABD4XE77_9RHOB|nr:zincin-like metallopeptidase domain-containing protein [Phaeobacter gallaeciensis]MDE4142163.1 zincin-like metallopeptidase domain-containing protein [Phaeobacter gallaeciensis]MDE4146641.1 zincin-like metallopeptidase domain-containing protein [Phaeobacter gallaeciensis]MDE4150596.1 zincin-like metallopeptidase domain-containing protein [Phaeobacter gallaeciensis]MDE4154893.1 zincin-like metallopeptidase domain-containing protein [Phaeobacter gallaeciensis]MDE4159217.1 zincin-like metallop
MAKSKPRFDAAASITNELIRIIERGVLPWRKPWTAGGSSRPLRVSGEPYQGVNNFLLTMRTTMAGYGSPFWMTMPQANAMDAKIRKGEKSSLVVYYGQSRKQGEGDGAADEGGTDDASVFRFQKSYRVFNADQIEGLDPRFHPAAAEPEIHPERAPIPHMQSFFEAIGAHVSFSGREACYVPNLDKIYMPPIELFENPRNFYAVWGHELGHWTKPRHRLNRSYGDARFGNTAYAREEIVAELCTVFLGQKLGFSAHTLELNAAYLDNWVRVLRSDKRAIFKHAADAQRACDYLVAASAAGQGEQAA